MTEMMDNTRKALVGYVLRIEDLDAEKVQVGEKIKEEYAAAAAAGFDKKALKTVIKRRRADMRKSTELRAVTDTYMRAIASFADTELGQWAQEWTAMQTTAENIAEPRATGYAGAKAKRNSERQDLN